MTDQKPESPATEKSFFAEYRSRLNNYKWTISLFGGVSLGERITNMPDLDQIGKIGALTTTLLPVAFTVAPLVIAMKYMPPAISRKVKIGLVSYAMICPPSMHALGKYLANDITDAYATTLTTTQANTRDIAQPDSTHTQDMNDGAAESVPAMSPQ